MARLKLDSSIVVAAVGLFVLVAAGLIAAYPKYEDFGTTTWGIILTVVAYFVMAYIKWDSEQSRARTEKKIEQIEVRPNKSRIKPNSHGIWRE
jgi:uncharacterized membrane protein YgaE (UPF0421/DUF939 family)